MIVYVEYVLLDNFIIDFIIFYSVAKILKLKIQKVRIVLACVLGVGFAFAIPFINITNIILFLIKLLMGVILVYVAFSFTKLKQFFLTYLSFIFLTFLLGGICYGLQGFVQSTKVINGTISYVNDFPVSLIIVAIFIFFILGKNLYSTIKLKKRFISISIFYKGKELKLNALIDSGNQLIDGKTKLPISFLSKQDFIKNFGQIDFCNNSTYENLMCKTITGTKILDTILVDKMIVENKTTILNARIALYDFDNKQEFNAIISTNLINWGVLCF